VKQYSRGCQVIRTIALLTALVLTVPSAGALVCDVICGTRHEASAAPPSGSCHDHGPSHTGSRTVSALHMCHEIGSVPASIMRDGGLQIAVAQAIVRGVDIVTDADATRDIVVRQERLASHAPPLPTLRLRI